MFLEIVNDVRHHVVSNNEYALEFASDGIFVLIFLHFWQGDQLCRFFLKRSRRTQGQGQAEITLISHGMSAISTGPEITSVTGCTSLTVELLDMSPFGQYAVQRSPRFEKLHLRSLMQKKASSVFRRIDFFAVLHHPSGCLSWI